MDSKYHSRDNIKWEPEKFSSAIPKPSDVYSSENISPQLLWDGDDVLDDLLMKHEDISPHFEQYVQEKFRDALSEGVRSGNEYQFPYKDYAKTAIAGELDSRAQRLFKEVSQRARIEFHMAIKDASEKAVEVANIARKEIEADILDGAGFLTGELEGLVADAMDEWLAENYGWH